VFTHNIYRNVRTRVIIVHDGRLLIHAPHAEGTERLAYRCLPGGGLEPNESLYECGEREVLEETGLRVRVRSVAFLREWVIPKMVSVDTMRAMLESWGLAHNEAPPPHAFGLEVYLWADLCDREATAPSLKDGIDEPAEWLPLEQIEEEPLFPSELRAIARNLLAGRPAAGVPSFVTGMGMPHDRPDYTAFDRV
jgi:8-oxo-dGTP pyrophosphatase MutT (NUDIX family)